MEQEILQRAVMLRQQSEEVEKQLDFLKEQIAELEKFSESLKIIKENKNKEIIAPMGKGVYVKASRDEKEKLFVEVGAGILIRKTPEEAEKIIENQISKFNAVKIQLNQQLSEFAAEFGKMMEEIQKLKNKQ